MRISWLLMGLVVLLIGVAIWRAAPEGAVKLPFVKSDEERAALAFEKAANRGLRDMLRDNDLYSFRNIIIGRRVGENGWDFRGQVEASGDYKATYGAAKLVCEDAAAARSDCWRFSSIVIDGEPRELPLQAPPPSDAASPQIATITPAEQEQQEPLQVEASVPSVSAAPAAEAQPPVSAQPVSAQPEVAQPEAAEPQVAAQPAAQPEAQPAPAAQPAAPADEASHVLDGAAVNARAGPGTSYDVLLILSSPQELKLLQTERDWGYYRLMGGENDGREVWLYATFVAAKAQ